jgi:hypothetical protein
MELNKKTEVIMPRITISLPDEDLDYIEKCAQQKALSASEYARTLIKLGLTIEKNLGATDPLNHVLDLEKQNLLWKTLLAWELETRYLVRHLVEERIPKNPGQQEGLLETAKIKAQERVDELLQHSTIK